MHGGCASRRAATIVGVKRHRPIVVALSTPTAKPTAVSAISVLGEPWKPRKPPTLLSFLASLSLLAAPSPSQRHTTPRERNYPHSYRRPGARREALRPVNQSNFIGKSLGVFLKKYLKYCVLFRSFFRYPKPKYFSV